MKKKDRKKIEKVLAFDVNAYLEWMEKTFFAPIEDEPKYVGQSIEGMKNYSQAVKDYNDKYGEIIEKRNAWEKISKGNNIMIDRISLLNLEMLVKSSLDDKKREIENRLESYIVASPENLINQMIENYIDLIDFECLEWCLYPHPLLKRHNLAFTSFATIEAIRYLNTKKIEFENIATIKGEKTHHCPQWTEKQIIYFYDKTTDYLERIQVGKLRGKEFARMLSFITGHGLQSLQNKVSGYKTKGQKYVPRPDRDEVDLFLERHPKIETKEQIEKK